MQKKFILIDWKMQRIHPWRVKIAKNSSLHSINYKELTPKGENCKEFSVKGWKMQKINLKDWKMQKIYPQRVKKEKNSQSKGENCKEFIRKGCKITKNSPLKGEKYQKITLKKKN